MLILNKLNYQDEGDKYYPTSGSTKLKDYSIWKDVTNAFSSWVGSNFVQAFITPGPMTNATASYKGMGALIFDGTFTTMEALIDGNSLNGGFASYVPEG